MEFDQAISIIDQALGQVNANRETHAVLSNAVATIKAHVQMLNSTIDGLKEQKGKS